MNYNLSCLEADLLINIYLLSGEQGVSEEDLISDYSINLSDLPWCCFDTSTVLMKCDRYYEDDDKEYSDEHIRMILKYALIQLKSQGLIKEKTKHYSATVEYDSIISLLKTKASSCPQFHEYVAQAFDYLDEDELSFILGDVDDDSDKEEFEETLSNGEEVVPIIRQSILSNTSDKEVSKILNHFTNARIITMNSSGKPYKFLPLFATVFEDNIYFILSPIFKNEFGEDKAALVFKRNEDRSFTIVTDETTETIFGLYQAAKERDINEK